MQIVTVRGSNNDCAAVGLGPMGSGCMFIVHGGWVRADGGGPSARLARGPSANKLRHCIWVCAFVCGCVYVFGCVCGCLCLCVYVFGCVFVSV